MVSALWTACSEGHLDTVRDLLKDASVADIEIKDESGATPLIEAVKNGHVEIARALLDRGADPRNASLQGPPETYTNDPALLDLLGAGQAVPPAHPSENAYMQNVGGDMGAPYYGPPAGYMYYPGMPPPPPMGDGAVYYPFPNADVSAGAGPIPPPDIARLIPCRYFPACRYGASCMFAHPPPSQYYSGPISPPNQYGAYDPATGHPYSPSYFPSFQPLNGMPSPAPSGMTHGRSPSEVPPFGPNNGVPPAPGQYAPQMMPPNGYLPVNGMYAAPPAPYAMQPNGSAPYPPPLPLGPASYPEVNGQINSTPLNPNSEGFVPAVSGAGNARRGNTRGKSFSSRKPPCLFFPAGKCKNGDDCRFPHVLTDQASYQQNQNGVYKGQTGRPRGPINNFATIDEKMANLSMRDGQARNGSDGFGRGQGFEGRGRFNPQAFGRGAPNQAQQKRLVKQRVPNADEFPVLAGSGGSFTGHVPGSAGLTAAQVLQAPAPSQKSSNASSAVDSVESTESNTSGSATEEIMIADVPSAPLPDVQTRFPVSFAAATAAPLDLVKEISVGA